MDKYYCFHCMHRLDSEKAVCQECGHDNRVRANREGYLQECVLDKKYLVGRMLGQGGFGITYIGRELLMNRRIAVKEYFPKLLGHRAADGSFEPYADSLEEFERGKERALHEARTGAGLGSIEGVVGTYSVIEENRTVYIIMEYVEGETLQAHIEKNGPMSFPEAQRFFEPVFRALEHIHEKGVIHSDISPDNIMIRRENGLPVLLDFGAARSVNRLGENSVSMTENENIFKTGYSPMEQHTKTGVPDARSDEYALAATIWFSLTGEQPEDALSRIVGAKLLYLSEARAKHENISETEAARLLQIRPEQEDALWCALSIRREERYENVSRFREALEAGTVSQRKKSSLLAAAVILAVLIAAAALLWWHPWRRTVSDETDISTLGITKMDNVWVGGLLPPVGNASGGKTEQTPEPSGTAPVIYCSASPSPSPVPVL